MKVVVDTNILFSAFLSENSKYRDLLFDQKHDSVTSVMQITEKGIILNGLKESLKGRKENYTHEKKFIKEVEKSHRETS